MTKPLYIEISESLKHMIITGQFSIGEKIPGDYELMKKYTASRHTIRKSIDILVNEGYLIRKPGLGTFLCRRRKTDSFEEIVSLSSEIIARGFIPSSKLLSFNEVPAKPVIADKIGCKTGEALYKIERLRFANELPFAYEETYLIKKYTGIITPEEIPDSMYEYLTYKKNIIFTKIMQEIKPMMLENEIAKLMDIPVMPVIKLERNIFNSENINFFYLTFIFRGDMYSIKSEVNLQ